MSVKVVSVSFCSMGPAQKEQRDFGDRTTTASMTLLCKFDEMRKGEMRLEYRRSSCPWLQVDAMRLNDDRMCLLPFARFMCRILMMIILHSSQTHPLKPPCRLVCDSVFKDLSRAASMFFMAF